MGQTPNGTDLTQRLFVGNLSIQITEDQLRAMVGKFGTIAHVHVVKAVSTDKPLGFAFVEMTDEQAAAQVIAALDGFEIDGRLLKVRARF